MVVGLVQAMALPLPVMMMGMRLAVTGQYEAGFLVQPVDTTGGASYLHRSWPIQTPARVGSVLNLHAQTHTPERERDTLFQTDAQKRSPRVHTYLIAFSYISLATNTLPVCLRNASHRTRTHTHSRTLKHW